MHGSLPLCRVCLKTSLEYIDLETPFSISPVHDKEEISDTGAASSHLEEFTYLDCFRECTRLKVELHNEFPQSLCGDCGFELRIAYEFIKKAESSAKILEEAVAKTKNEASSNIFTQHNRLHISNVASGVKFDDYGGVGDDSSSMLDIECNESEIKTVQYKCNFCDKLFYSQVGLNLHTSKMHYDLMDILEFKPQVSYTEEELNNEESIEVEYIDHDENTSETLLQENYEPFIDIAENPNIDYNTIDTIKSKKNITKGIYKCSICDDTFCTNRSLQLHFQTKHQVLHYNCDLCFETFSKEKYLRKHIKEVHSQVVGCFQCEFQGKEHEVREHEQQMHIEKKNFLCNICSKTFTTLGILNAHLKYHQRKQANQKSDACKTCGKQFSTKHYLRLHMEVHKNDRELHQCNQCDKMYVTKTALDNHMKLHKGDTIKCLLCDKEFSRQYELNVHMRFHTRDYPFECEVCGKKFAIKGHLRTHMWRHQGLKLQCEDCGKLFTSSKALQEHSFTHSEMPYPCSYCPKAYPSKQKFKVHLKSAHNVELNDDELHKVFRNNERKPLIRKKLTLVQADSVMKEVEVKTKNDDNEDIQEFAVELY